MPWPSVAASASSPPIPWPSYAAVDYNRSGHPSLSRAEVGSIRSTLAKVKPCQRTLLRYAFPPQPNSLPFVLFFEPEDGNNGTAVIGEPRTYYLVSDGEVISASPTDPAAEQIEKFGIQFLINHTRCASAP